MLVNTKFLPSGELQIDAYSFSLDEFLALEETLRTAGVNTISQQIPSDASGRDGRRYTATSTQTKALEELLGGKFQSNGEFVSSVGAGNPYACVEINLSGKGVGCEELLASDKSSAQTKCALIARKNGWFGGVPNEGTCQ